MTARMYSFAIVGASGIVGLETLKILEQRNFPIGELRLYGSSCSADKTLLFRGKQVVIKELFKNSLGGPHPADLAIFSAGAEISKQYAPIAAGEGTIVIDNSSAFRMDADVPLIIPEINPAEIEKGRDRKIIANPNCTTAIALMALWPLHQKFGLLRVVADSYQAASGAGGAGLKEYQNQIHVAHWNPSYPDDADHKVFPWPLVGNVIPHIGEFDSDDNTLEELKFGNEGRKIMSLPDLRADITCVRVPVARVHCISMSAEFEKPIPSLTDARLVLCKAPGIEMFDVPMENLYPMPIVAAGKDNCYVGRIRRSHVFQNGLQLFVAGDQIRKGAALNAVQIAEHLIE